MDLAAAKAAPGVIAIVTAQNAGKLGKGNFNTARLLGGPEIQHYHQAIALVVAETFEQARAAAHLVRVEYAPAKGAFDLAAVKDAAKPADSFGAAAETAVGDFAGAFAARPCKLDATLHHGARIALDDGAARERRRVGWRPAHALDLEPDDRVDGGGHGEDARHARRRRCGVMSPYIGGGFGAKLWMRADALLAALGARAARRPVKVALQRALDAQQYGPPLGDDPAHPHRRHEGRQDHRHRPRELVGRPPGRRARKPRRCRRGRSTRGPTA